MLALQSARTKYNLEKIYQLFEEHQFFKLMSLENLITIRCEFDPDNFSLDQENIIYAKIYFHLFWKRIKHMFAQEPIYNQVNPDSEYIDEGKFSTSTQKLFMPYSQYFKNKRPVNSKQIKQIRQIYYNKILAMYLSEIKKYP